MKKLKSFIQFLSESSISDLVSADQKMRSNDKFDTKVDLENQKTLKKILTKDPENVLKSIDNPEDVDGVWLIAQHADNDIKFQIEILDLFKKLRDFFAQKFKIDKSLVNRRIAMLTDRISINSTTSLKGYRNNGKPPFDDMKNGKQVYGSQGGEYKGKWVHRPIEIDDELVFHETPEEAIKDVEFMKKINARRTSMGLDPYEEYIKQMNK
jgi:hypothetical protein